jgi:hypothetical protein
MNMKRKQPHGWKRVPGSPQSRKGCCEAGRDPDIDRRRAIVEARKEQIRKQANGLR